MLSIWILIFRGIESGLFENNVMVSKGGTC